MSVYTNLRSRVFKDLQVLPNTLLRNSCVTGAVAVGVKEKGFHASNERTAASLVGGRTICRMVQHVDKVDTLERNAYCIPFGCTAFRP